MARRPLRAAGRPDAAARVGLRSGRHQAGDRAADDPLAGLPHLLLHVHLLVDVRLGVGARAQTHQTLVSGDGQHQRHGRRRVRLGRLAQQVSAGNVWWDGWVHESSCTAPSAFNADGWGHEWVLNTGTVGVLFYTF